MARGDLTAGRRLGLQNAPSTRGSRLASRLDNTSREQAAAAVLVAATLTRGNSLRHQVADDTDADPAGEQNPSWIDPP